MASDPWYKDGLQFACTECGKCCTGGPGVVWIQEHETYGMAGELKVDIQTFADLYTRKINGRWALKEKAQSYDCIFLDDGRCSLYGARPTQCRTFPFWPEHLSCKKAWDELECEGKSDDAPLISFERIEAMRKLQESVDD